MAYPRYYLIMIRQVGLAILTSVDALGVEVDVVGKAHDYGSSPCSPLLRLVKKGRSQRSALKPQNLGGLLCLHPTEIRDGRPGEGDGCHAQIDLL